MGYENSPEAIELKEKWMTKIAKLESELKQLQELAQAKAEGRLVEVVRCKDCVHSRWPDSEEESAYIECYDGVFNNNRPKRVRLTDYCSYGVHTTDSELKGGDTIATT